MESFFDAKLECSIIEEGLVFGQSYRGYILIDDDLEKCSRGSRRAQLSIKQTSERSTGLSRGRHGLCSYDVVIQSLILQ